MRKFFRMFLCGLLCIVCFQIVQKNSNFITFAQSPIPRDSTISAVVGRFTLTASGYASPYATVTLTSNGVLLASTIADSQGNFYFSDILIQQGFSGFCVRAVDFKRIGDSQACIQVPPATGSITIRDIFLAPTIGISATQIKEGESVQIFGYTVPGATVTIKANGTTVGTVTADSTGYYVYDYKNAKAGTYTFTAEASFNNLNSLPPTRDVTLKVLSGPEIVVEPVTNIIKVTYKQTIKIIRETSQSGLIYILISILLLILILITILKLHPEWFRFILDKIRTRKKMHHDWLLEFLKEHQQSPTQTVRVLTPAVNSPQPSA